jgi:hypothetical protein
MMFRLIPMMVVAVLLSFIAGFAGCDKQAAEVEAADVAYDNFLDADDGAGAVGFVSKDSLARLDRLIGVARKAKKSEVQALPYNDRLEVLQIRMLLKRDLLKPVDGRSYYAKLVSSGWVNSTSDLERIKVKVDSSKTSATVTYRLPGTSETTQGFWVLEDGAWKEDQVAQNERDRSDYKAHAKEAGMTEDEYLLTTLEDRAGEKVPPTIWDVPK